MKQKLQRKVDEIQRQRAEDFHRRLTESIKAGEVAKYEVMETDEGMRLVIFFVSSPPVYLSRPYWSRYMRLLEVKP